jgi:Zn-dependent peptidase ImmA (M78 family)
MRVYPQINQNLLNEAAKLASPPVWTKFPALQDWLNGEKKPTVNQLADFAKAVHIPFGFFFLDELPKLKNTVPLFRSGSKKPLFEYSYELSETIRTILRRQDWLVDYFNSEGKERLHFVGSASSDDSVNGIAGNIRATLELPKNWSQFLPDKNSALNYLIQKTEDAGIFVSINGVLGNSSKNLDPGEFKGFVLSDAMAPYIFINEKDFPAAKLFTLAHELAHIWLGKTAVLDINKFQPADTKDEKLCDAVAAELLVAREILVAEWEKAKNSSNHLLILERFFKVSRVVIARRLLDIGKYTKPKFFAFYNQYRDEWEAKSEKRESGGSFYSNQNYRVGKAFFNTVHQAAKSGKLLYTDAYRLTELYGATFHKYQTLNL